MTFTATRGLHPEPMLLAAANVQALSREVLEATGGVLVPELLLHRLGSLIDAGDLLFLDIHVKASDTEHRLHEEIEAVAVTVDLVAHVHAQVSSSRSSQTQQLVTSEIDVRPTNLIQRLVVETEDATPSATHPASRPGLRSVRLLFADGRSLSVPVSEQGRDRVWAALRAFLPPTRRTA